MARKIQAPADLPQYNQMMWPAIESLKEFGGSATTSELIARIAEKMNISAETQTFQREGKPRTELYLRIDWTKWYLRRAGVIEYQDKFWRLLPYGRKLTEDQVKEIPAKVRKLCLSKEDEDIPGDDEPTEKLLNEDAWKTELLNALKAMDPGAFERLTRLLLTECGFEDVKVTGKSNDRGIDGTGTLRVNLLSFHVMFQCKRYKSTVPPEHIRDFRGALDGRADRGLFISTGTYGKGAREEASRNASKCIELIDGEELCKLLKEHKIGIKTTLVERVDLDPTFFTDI